MFVHVGTDISIVAVAQNRNVVEEDIRSLKTELVEPAVFRDDVFQLVVGEVVVRLHSQNIVSSKSRHENPSFSQKV